MKLEKNIFIKQVSTLMLTDFVEDRCEGSKTRTTSELAFLFLF